MKRPKTARENAPIPRDPQPPHDEPPKRKIPEAVRMRMQVDTAADLDTNGQRTTKKLPRQRARYRPYTPPNFECLGPSGTSSIAATQHIGLQEATTTQGGLTTTRIEAQLIGHTSTPLPPHMTKANPHWGQIPEETQMNATTIPFTTTALPKIAHKTSVGLGNMREGLRRRLNDKKAISALLIPFGAGNRFVRDNPKYAEQAAAFLNSLKGAEANQITVVAPSPQFTPPPRARFAMPFAYVATNIPKEVKDLLIEQQTFAFQVDGRKHAFTAIEVPGETPTSWVIANFTGECVTNNPDKMARALEAIINTLFDDTDIAREANKALAEEGIGGSVLERKAIALSTMSLTHIPRKNELGEDSPAWQLAGQPIHNNHKGHRTWLKAIRRLTFELDDMQSISSTADVIGCVWCKAETHSSEYCPFPKIKDWKGPMPNAEEYVRPEPPYKPDAGARKAKDTKKGRKNKENGTKDRARLHKPVE
ncbi:hypothetical protein PC9H_002604 [Pleurotus ostreatus]|uniref:Uncharacterized protein n=1 Tax=Pleurotus ostreatus TaxID=5322 RepID=A0A8H7DMC9_PLEOS|nr:uncharacterized protein PC9H_002604 [Pleurotus ostreatus]KAF7416339.1 hypothetical protein PC9H_002604 [Pleurotus ostreatus]KAJ8689228.1 hypothetical protein PTI98_013271 [Pleurotus ostreatus]